MKPPPLITRSPHMRYMLPPRNLPQSPKTASPPTTSRFQSLPQELIDAVIDHAQMNKSLLASCSLVCKAWFPAARRHLFSDTKLTPENAFSFFSLVTSSSSSSTLVPFVRRIEAKDNYESDRWFNSLFGSLTSLTALTSISFTSASDTILSHSTLFTLSSFDCLVELKLAECQFADFAHVQELICSFPVLETLHLEADWPEPRIISPTDASPSPYLRELYLRCEMSHILEWFLMQPHVAAVSKLTLHGLDASELSVVSRYMQTLGSALTHLSISPIGPVYDSLPRHSDLSLNVSLQYLKLAIDCDSTNLDMARLLLSQLESQRFNEVELSCYAVRQGPKLESYWANLDNLLVTPKFSSLKRVTVAAMSAAGLACKTLPLCHRRGILQVNHH